MADSSTLAHKLLYILVVEQKLRAGGGMSPQLLAADLNRHGFSAQDQQDALEAAVAKGWLQKGPMDEVQLTETGARVDFAQ